MRIVEVFQRMGVEEGINDPGIFKAVFLAGGPGSGKSFIADKVLKGQGLVYINSDEAFEHLMRKHGLDPKMPPEQEKEREVQRARAKGVAGTKQRLAIDGRLGILIDGTGDDVGKISKIKSMLEVLGYETKMIMVNTALDVALSRNAKRQRSVPEDVAVDIWNAVQRNIGQFQRIFGGKDFYVIDNSTAITPETKSQLDKLWKEINLWIKLPPKKQAAKKWLQSEKDRLANLAKKVPEQPPQETT